MNSIWWQVAGWTMIHFLWIGSLVFMVTALLRLALFRAAPQLRYAVSLLGLTMLAFSPMIIAWRLAGEIEPVVLAIEPVADVAPERYELPPMDSISAVEISEPTVIDLKYTPFEAPVMEEPIEAAVAEPVVTASSPIAPTPPSIEPAFDPFFVFQTLPGYLPWLWMIGTPATLLLLATGLMGSERLRQRAEPITDPALLDTLAKLTAALRLSRRVTIAVSDRVLQPVLVGIVRPLILLPSVALTSWSPAEIEMALLHELAHVRRWDNLVNLVQRLVESLLFFHPAVWITSRWVRADREHCCDAVVVAHCGNREAYANLLVSVAKSSMSGRLPSHAMAMTSHPLARRVRRILQLEDDPMLVSKRTLLSVAVLLAALTAGAVWSSTLAEETKGEPEAPVSGGKERTTESTEDAENTETIILHPDLTEAELNDIRKKLADEGTGYTISVDGPFVFLRSNEGVVKATRIEITGKDWRLLGPKEEKSSPENYTVLVAELHGFPSSLIESQIEQATKELNEYITEVTRSSWGHVQLFATRTDGVQFTTDFEGPTKSYDISGAIPYERVNLLVTAHENAGNIVEVRRGDGNYYQVVVTKPGSTATVKPGEPDASAPGVAEVKEGTTESTDTVQTAAEILAALEKKPGALVLHPGMSPADRNAFNAFVGNIRKTGDDISLHVGDSDVSLITKQGTLTAKRMVFCVHEVAYQDSNGELQVQSLQSSAAKNLPFLSLEDQRIADLAYGMLGVEVAAINAEELAAVKEKGFAGGVKIESIGNIIFLDAADARSPSRPKANTHWQRGDILVGLHVWPTTSFDELGEVLRRGDLNQFIPLKYYVLRSEIDEEWVREVEAKRRKDEIERQETDPFGGVGRAPRGRGADSAAEPVSEARYIWRLRTGRIAFDTRKWSEEQHRLASVDKPQHAEEVSETNLKSPKRVYPLLGEMSEEEVKEKVRNSRSTPPPLVSPENTVESEVTPPVETTPLAEPTKDAPPQLLYDGRTFDDWRTEWKTELKTEKRTAAIEALSAFGRAGDGREAAETILDVAGEYDPSRMYSPESLKNLKEAITSVMTGGPRFLPTNDWVKLLLARVNEADTDEQRQRWTGWLIETMKNSSVSSPEMQEALLDLIAKSSELQNPEQAKRLREQAITSLVRGDYELQNEQVFQLVKSELNASPPNAGMLIYTRFRFLDRLPEQVELLLHPDNTVRMTAQHALGDLGQQEGSPEVFKTLLNVLADPKRTEAHAAAIAAIHAGVNQTISGPVNAMYYTIQDALTEIIVEGEEAVVRPAAAVLAEIGRRSDYDIIQGIMKKHPELSQERKQFLENIMNEIQGRGRS